MVTPYRKLYKNIKQYKKHDFKNYCKNEKTKLMSSVFRNKRDDLWVKRDLMIEHFKQSFK